MTGIVALYIFMLAAFTGYEVIAKVPVILHTPLMSGSNFVHGIVLVGAMVALGQRARRRSRRPSASSACCWRPATRSAATSSPSACSRCSRPAAAQVRRKARGKH